MGSALRNCRMYPASAHSSNSGSGVGGGVGSDEEAEAASFVEFCALQDAVLPGNCWLSHLHCGVAALLPASLRSAALMLLPVLDDASEEPVFALVYIGLDDDPKASPPLFLQRPHAQLLQRLGVSPDELWGDQSEGEERSLWTAPLFPLFALPRDQPGAAAAARGLRRQGGTAPVAGSRSPHRRQARCAT